MKHQNASPSSLPPTLPTLGLPNSIPPPRERTAQKHHHNSTLRVRPKSVGRHTKNNIHTSTQQNEFYSALLPVLLIAAVWCFGCYVYLWISLYKSFSEDIDEVNGHIVFKNKRRDILAIKLEQFLTGDTDVNIGNDTWFNSHSLPVSYYSGKITLLDQIGDIQIAKQIQSALADKTEYPNLILGAYLEPQLMTEEVNGHSFMKLRTDTPQNLTYISYPYQQQSKESAIPPGACSKMGAQWLFPTFHSKSLDNTFESNVFKKHPNFDKRWDLAPYCPVDADPYLPWIHDAFPSNDGSYIEFIISNKRRCNTDPNKFQFDLQNLEPQVALMQPIPIKRIKEESDYSDALNKLWSPASDYNKQETSSETESFIVNENIPRYTLATSLEDADSDGKYTRFICRFHTQIIDAKSGSDEPILKKMILGESLSVYTYNHELANYRKRNSKPMLTPSDKGHDEQIWNSVYTTRCPVPHFRDNNGNATNKLGDIIASGRSVFDGTPSLYVDLIPIRTPVRRDRAGFGLPGVTQSASGEPRLFDPKLAWGNAHVLPRVEASGRWVNIPICLPPKMDEGLASADDNRAKVSEPTNSHTESAQNQSKTHFLVACVWASASFPTRGQTTNTDSSTSDRLHEFLSYHTQLAGFDHVYVYDNSDTSESNDTLAGVTDLFSSSLVTRIPWPHRICNNNRPMHANPGERSSQYAAENSCRARYGPDTTWMASLDVDEYLIPTGKQKNVRSWLDDITRDEESTKILSFYQTRALPNVNLLLPYEGSSTSACKVRGSMDVLDSMCLVKVRRLFIIF